VAYLPPGSYRLESPVDLALRRGATLRGAGPGQTLRLPADGIPSAVTTGQVGLVGARTVLDGSRKGSTRLVLGDASGIN